MAKRKIFSQLKASVLCPVVSQDVGEKGLKLVSALNKCERFRNVGLKKGAPRSNPLLPAVPRSLAKLHGPEAGFTLGALKEMERGCFCMLRPFLHRWEENFGAGILLREFALEMTSQPPSHGFQYLASLSCLIISY